MIRHLTLFVGLLLFTVSCSQDSGWKELQYRTAPVDNPLKGLVPYLDSNAVSRFPHSLAFQYFSLRELMPGRDQYDWSPVEKALEKGRESGCQMVLRVYLEFPGRRDSIPEFLLQEGVAVTNWKMETEDGGLCQSPDYADPRLRSALVSFIEAFGARYDQDPRVGFLTAGLLGSWGEWHTWPRDDLMASKNVQTEILEAFEKHFPTVPVLLRYPANSETWAQASNVDRPFGYHDDSFSWATLDTGKKEDNWFFMPSLKAAGATEKWKTQPIGGEIRPELWTHSFTDQPHEKDQGFAECVTTTHVTWLMDSGLFEKRFPMDADRKSRALQEVGRMGYEFFIKRWKLEDGQFILEVENRGVAPFYRNWPIEMALFEGDQRLFGKVVSGVDYDLRTILPGAPVTWVIDVSEWKVPKNAVWKLKIPNPMDGGHAIRFANETQEGDWLVLSP